MIKLPSGTAAMIIDTEGLATLCVTPDVMDHKTKALKALKDIEPDNMVADANNVWWLIHQLLKYPERVDPKNTTNLRFLMQSAARTIAHNQMFASLVPVNKESE